jgi:guanylate kinase
MTKPDPAAVAKRGQAYQFEPMFSRIVSTTTRARRDGEVEGVDYNFISVEQSLAMEKNGEFAELITFQGVRYGVTHKEMQGKMHGDRAPIVILEPKGLEMYEQLCRDNGWEIFKIYVHTVESERIARLNRRTALDIRNALHNIAKSSQNVSALLTSMDMHDAAEKLIHIHTNRLLSITGEERAWSNVTRWDLQVPGDDVNKAIQHIEQGIKWRNYRNAQLNT